MRIFPLAAAAIGLTLAAGPAAADSYRLSLSTWGSPKHPQVSHFVPEFTKLVGERSDGRIKFRTFEGGEMVKQQFVPTAVPQGTVDISLTTLDNWSGRISDVTILTTPLWTRSMKDTLGALKPGQPIYDYFDKKLREQGAILLCAFDIGPPVLSTSFPIEHPSDLAGKKIRVYSKGAGQMMQALKAAPTTMSVGEVYSALQRGTVDGAIGGLQGAVGLKHFEVTKYMLAPMGALGTLIHAYVMNKDKFESMPEDLQKIVMESAAEARDAMQGYIIDKYGDFVDQVRKHGNTVTVLEAGTPGYDEWRNALQGVNDEARRTYPKELVELIETK